VPTRTARSRSLSAASGLVLLAVVAACAPAPTSPAPPPEPTPSLAAAEWARVGAAVRAASAVAADEAAAYARGAVGEWTARVRERTRTELVPWLGAYSTRRWLALKLAWYRTGNGEEAGDPAAATRRLAAYLEGEYRSRVLEPVAEQISPTQIRHQAAAFYVQALREAIDALATRDGVPRAGLERRLAEVPAIGSPPGASLLDLIRAADPATLPAYQSLLEGARAGEDDAPPGDALLPVARCVAVDLARTAALQGGTSAASIAGGVPGLLIALGVSAWDAAAYEQWRPALEASLEQELDIALEALRARVLEDRAHGVLAPVAHMAAQIDGTLPATPDGGDAPAIEGLW
jgi:hypothetical protein